MKNWIICSGTDWFRPSVTSTGQIMFQFERKGYNILWVNPIAFKSPAVNSINNKSIRKKIFHKLKTHLVLFKKINKGFYIYVPIYLPVFSSSGDQLNAVLIKLQLGLITSLLNIKIKDTILWISGSFTLSPLLNKPFLKKVYHAADLISEFRTNNESLLLELKKKEIHLSTNVDYLFASSPNIKNKLEKLSGREVTILTHGVDFDHFNQVNTIHPRMKAIQNKGLPIAGYYGTLSDANDKDVFKILAENGFSVVIIGKVSGDYSMLEQKNNIHFFGPVNFQELPTYARAFDICLLNWIMADWIRNSYPIKTLEYLAMGKPIVSCRIPVVEQLFGPLVYFADTSEEFLLKAREALRENNTELIEKRIRIASEHTWEKKFEIIENTML